MNTARFTIRFLTRIIIFTVISIIALTLLSASPIITNEMAMGQMENSNELYMVMEIYNRVKPIISIIYGCIATWFVGTTIYDIYKLITKENN